MTAWQNARQRTSTFSFYNKSGIIIVKICVVHFFNFIVFLFTTRFQVSYFLSVNVSLFVVMIFYGIFSLFFSFFMVYCQYFYIIDCCREGPAFHNSNLNVCFDIPSLPLNYSSIRVRMRVMAVWALLQHVFKQVIM